jgi:hypothetical protein
MEYQDNRLYDIESTESHCCAKILAFSNLTDPPPPDYDHAIKLPPAYVPVPVSHDFINEKLTI